MTTDLKKKKFNPLLAFVWIFQGILIGFGAILPGVSGGALCAAFGLYRPIMETISNPRDGLKKYGIMMVFVILGVAAGFVGLSGVAAFLLGKNEFIVMLAFIGLIVGTFPELWADAGSEGRTKGSYISAIIGFVAMLSVLILLKNNSAFTLTPGIWAYALCGVLWGLSFIVPGLSSSTLIMFFGLYQPMTEGISRLDFKVLIPLALGMAACVLPLARLVQSAFKKHFNILSHGIFGIVVATTVMIFPKMEISLKAIATAAIIIVCGAIVSYILTRVCEKIKKDNS